MTFAAHIEHDPHAWRKDANCLGKPVSLFFVVNGNHYHPEAIACCAACDPVVRSHCLADALAGPPEWDRGYRGGATAEQREKMRGRRAS